MSFLPLNVTNKSAQLKIFVPSFSSIYRFFFFGLENTGANRRKKKAKLVLERVCMQLRFWSNVPITNIQKDFFLIWSVRGSYEISPGAAD